MAMMKWFAAVDADNPAVAITLLWSEDHAHAVEKFAAGWPGQANVVLKEVPPDIAALLTEMHARASE